MRDTNTVLLELDAYDHMVDEIKESRNKILELQVDLKNTLLENRQLRKNLEKATANRQMIENT